MREYIIYSAIIFLPIGAIMSFQLSREGLMAKFIAVIMVASLGIIISFPIALQRLGLFAALLLYALLLLALTWYFLKSLQSDEGTLASTEDRSIIEDDLVRISASHQIETTEIVSVIEDDVIRPSYDIEIVDKIEDIKTIKELIGIYINPLDRNLTVELSSVIALLNGCIVMPGATFSMVKTLHQKVIQTPAINSLAQAIYQACVDAHIEVVERPARTEAFKDVKFMNNLGNPVLLYLAMEENQLLVKIFGCQTEAGREISLSREQTVLTPELVEKVSPGLKPQERIVQQEGKNGMQLRTYRLVKVNGREVAKDLLAEENYPPLNTIILTAPGNIIK